MPDSTIGKKAETAPCARHRGENKLHQASDFLRPFDPPVCRRARGGARGGTDEGSGGESFVAMSWRNVCRRGFFSNGTF